MVTSYPMLAQWCAQLQDWQNFRDTEPKIGAAGALSRLSVNGPVAAGQRCFAHRF